MPRKSDRAFENAAISVLRRARTPLRLREITERVIAETLFSPTGKTPIQSLYSIIYRANQRSVLQGMQPIFIVHREGKRNVRYSLRKD